MLFSTAEGDSLVSPAPVVAVDGTGLASETPEGSPLACVLGLEADVAVLGATIG
jgi:hypothetical protein